MSYYLNFLVFDCCFNGIIAFNYIHPPHILQCVARFAKIVKLKLANKPQIRGPIIAYLG